MSSFYYFTSLCFKFLDQESTSEFYIKVLKRIRVQFILLMLRNLKIRIMFFNFVSSTYIVCNTMIVLLMKINETVVSLMLDLQQKIFLRFVNRITMN